VCKADSASFNQPGTNGVSCTETLGNTVIYMQYLCDYARAAVAMTAAAAQVQVRLTGLLTSSFFIALQKPALSQACAWSISVRPCRQHGVRQSHGPYGGFEDGHWTWQSETLSAVCLLSPGQPVVYEKCFSNIKHKQADALTLMGFPGTAVRRMGASLDSH